MQAIVADGTNLHQKKNMGIKSGHWENMRKSGSSGVIVGEKHPQPQCLY